MSKPRDLRQRDLLRPPLDEVIDLDHALVRLGKAVDWNLVERQFGLACRPGSGQPPLPTRLVAGLLMLKHLYDLSDDALCVRWLENPYFQHFCGEESFCHRMPLDRTSLTKWRRRLGEPMLTALIEGQLSAARKRVPSQCGNGARGFRRRHDSRADAVASS